MDESMTDSVLARLRASGLDSVAGQLGTDPATADKAVAAAVPMLLGALGHNAQQPGGAEALLGALQRDHQGQGAVDVDQLLQAKGGREDRAEAAAAPPEGDGLAGLLGRVLGGGAASRQLDGEGILGHILGGSRDGAAAGLSRLSGLDGQQSGQLLRLLAPIVMGLLAKRVSAGNLGAGGLGSLLGQERTRVQQGGGLAGDLLNVALGQMGGGSGVGGVLGKLAGSLLKGGR